MKRRHFLQAGGVLAVGFVAGCAIPVIPKRPAAAYEDALGWVRHANGRYELLLPRAEMGQNIATALKQVACDELGVDWDRVTLRLPHTQDIPRVRATVGSESVKDFALPLAQACATLRDALAAGHTTGVRSAEPRPMNELRAFRSGARLVGRRVPLEQGRAIVTGAPLYAADVRLPGMVFGRVLRAPVSADRPSRLAGWNEAAARAVPGFVALVQDERLMQRLSPGLGIVARTPGTLDRIEAALAPRWQHDDAFEQADIDRLIDIDRHLAGGRLGNQIHDDAIDRSAAWDLDLRIDTPLAAHNAIEPRAAVAAEGADGVLEVWAGTQDAFYVRDVIAHSLGLDDAALRVQACRVGGAFGGRTLCTVELEAAVLAHAIGAPVKVQWTRAQEYRQGFHRPPSSHRIRARVRNGELVDWWHAFSSSHILFTNAGMPVWMQRLADLVGDRGVARGADLPYRALRRRTEFAVTRLPVFTGPWRGLGAGPNALAIESAIDECARLAGADPVAFRLRHIGEPRLARVLRTVVDGVPAPTPAAGSDRVGRGVACGTYKASSHAAVLAEVRVAPDGTVVVTRLRCAHDCGTVINPDQVRAQCEGNLVWGLGMVLHDGLTAAGSRIAAGSLGEAPVPSLRDTPPMDIVLIDDDGPPAGAGETAIVAAAGAIANAIRGATGVRLTRFPLQPSLLARRGP
ncbi:xanthine dehydrogenase family protein molybdopterin-binding subunit [Hydrogenophaga sp. H7]|uniref:xanthine dehydrogenase family protein molybdopterin-binding subunit n=1 Tax=Hydrogenophaga sp. H7 TaxID=1882399 RepID=UPI0009A3E53F|nr:molybdopterin cofactor-binding domain-containing protein [Hydrogenophaga sp. H7]OPF65384.1 Isoquinoline 1-oxidoreductase [Hydrogenophaga sp. H7]